MNCRADVVLRGEAAVDVAGADAQFQHHGRVGGFGKIEALFDGAHDRGQIRPRIEQPHLRFHGEGMRALLHDAGAFAVVFADDDERAAGDAAGGEIRERVGGDVGADRGFESDGAAQRIVDRGGQRGGGGGFGGAVLEMDAEFFENVVGVGEHVHQVRDGRALIAGDIGNAGLRAGLW